MGLILPLFSYTDFRQILTVIYICIAAATIGLIIHEKRDPVKALAWILLIALVPVVGMLIYVIFGRYHRKQKIFDLKELTDLEQFEKISREQIETIYDPDKKLLSTIAENRNIITLLLNNSKSPLTTRNRVKVLNNGKATFAEIFEAIKNATSTIHIEYYIFANDRIGKRLASLLREKARQGIEVRFIYDDVGSWGLTRKFLKRLRSAGVEIGCFMPVAFPWLTSRVNYRNHRKIIVVDGKVAFTGGINIAERYLKRGKYGIWRDTHLKLEGESVWMLQAIFATDWYFVSGRKRLTDFDKYFPPTDIDQELLLQIASSGPDSDWASIMQAFFAAITNAKEHIYISTPYFLPNQSILTALKVAALSGIDVRVLIPSRSDSKIVYWATRSYISELIEAGIKVYLYRKGFNHSKVIMIDSSFCSIGTANMDMRSFEDNFEVTALIYDRKTATELESYFMADLENSIPVTSQMWERRSNLHSAYESLARLLSPLL